MISTLCNQGFITVMDIAKTILHLLLRYLQHKTDLNYNGKVIPPASNSALTISPKIYEYRAMHLPVVFKITITQVTSI
uniref:Uncharacterized protein n=1 Tax=Strigamia maritima TaxID=126957 RepID=T1J1C8_STRMM